MITYHFLQQYWWLLISLLGGLLVFLLFVQGANTLIFRIGRTEEEREMIVNSTGRKWEFTFTTLVTFGGAFFASFPLFYSTSFGGAYWVWMLILASFVLQAVAYEYQSKPGNVYGRNIFRYFLGFNGFFGPFLLGAAVATFFTGSEFIVEKNAIGSASLMPVISRWANNWHGLDALANPWNWCLGFAVFFLARILGSLYLINNIDDADLQPRFRRQLIIDAVPFLIFFLAFVGKLLLGEGFAVDANGMVSLVKGKYAANLFGNFYILLLFIWGVIGVLMSIILSIVRPSFKRGIWTGGIGTVLTVMSLFLIAGLNGTSYYPSTADLQSSLTIGNSCSSEFTLRTMAIVSLLIPFVLAYIFYCWRAIDKRPITRKEMETEEHKY